MSERSKIALVQNDSSACSKILSDFPFVENSSIFNELRVIQFICRKDYDNSSALCIDWMKKAQSEEIIHIFYFWFMVIAKKCGASDEAKSWLENLTKITY